MGRAQSPRRSRCPSRPKWELGSRCAGCARSSRLPWPRQRVPENKEGGADRFDPDHHGVYAGTTAPRWIGRGEPQGSSGEERRRRCRWPVDHDVRGCISPVIGLLSRRSARPAVCCEGHGASRPSVPISVADVSRGERAQLGLPAGCRLGGTNPGAGSRPLRQRQDESSRPLAERNKAMVQVEALRLFILGIGEKAQKRLFIVHNREAQNPLGIRHVSQDVREKGDLRVCSNDSHRLPLWLARC